MSEIIVKIDGIEVAATEGMTILDAAKKAGVSIPTLCYLEELKPYGACRFCSVEASVRGRPKVVAACLYPVEKDLEVRVHTEQIDRIRKMILELMSAHAPDSFEIQDLAKEYGADRNRFPKDPSFCVHCALCVRYCNEIAKKNAIQFVDKGKNREICFIPEIASKECWKCKGCFPLCPTEYLQGAYVLVKALGFPEASSESVHAEQ